MAAQTRYRAISSAVPNVTSAKSPKAVMLITNMTTLREYLISLNQEATVLKILLRSLKIRIIPPIVMAYFSKERHFSLAAMLIISSNAVMQSNSPTANITISATATLLLSKSAMLYPLLP